VRPQFFPLLKMEVTSPSFSIRRRRAAVASVPGLEHIEVNFLTLPPRSAVEASSTSERCVRIFCLSVPLIILDIVGVCGKNRLRR